MRAAERQTERTSKPVICLRRKSFNPSDREVLEPQVNVAAMIPFELRNVGNGTALKIHWRFKNESGKEIIHGMIPNLQSGHCMSTGLTPGQLGLMEGVSRDFECEYTSLSKDMYRSVIRIEHLNLVSFEEEKISWWRDCFGRKAESPKKS